MAAPVSYFDHNARRTSWEVVEWPEPIEVQESSDPEEVERVRKEWERRIAGD